AGGDAQAVEDAGRLEAQRPGQDADAARLDARLELLVDVCPVRHDSPRRNLRVRRNVTRILYRTIRLFPRVRAEGSRPRRRGTAVMPRRPLRIATFLAPDLFPFYADLVRRVGQRLGRATELFVGTAYEQMFTDADAGFLCGLAYIELAGGPG